MIVMVIIVIVALALLPGAAVATPATGIQSNGRCKEGYYGNKLEKKMFEVPCWLCYVPEKRKCR